MPENVTILGAGIAGLTAALRLTQRGYDVTIYDQNPYIGGNLGALRHRNVYHEHCYHMFLNWYVNFWHIVEHDLGLERSQEFEARTALHHLRQGEFPSFKTLYNPGSPDTTLTNLRSGVEPAADLLLWVYSLVDLASEFFRIDDLLDQQSVTGFMRSRYYATNRSAGMHEDTLAKAFASPSYLTSASSYKNFVKYGLRHPDPLLWVLKGNSYEHLLKHLESRLKDTGHCTIILNRRARGVRVEPVGATGAHGNVTRIAIQNTYYNQVTGYVESIPKTLRSIPVANLIIAVPPNALADMLDGENPKWRLLDYLPSLTNVRRLRSESIASLDLYFKRRLTGIPKEHVILLGSRYGLTFVDNSQTWTRDPQVKNRTVLSVAATNYYALPRAFPQEDALRVIWELHDYLQDKTGVSPFDPGTYWGQSKDIDWKCTYFQANAGDQLVVNETGSERNRPEPHYDEVQNLFFAGDFCANPIDVVTVEGAVVSGLRAARALHSLRTTVDPIEILQPESYSDSLVLATKLLLSPVAYAAKAWDTVGAAISSGSGNPSPRPMSELMGSLFAAPYTYTADWWKTFWSLCGATFSPGNRRRPGS